jgi:preprotein translocase subunit SecA
VLKREVIVPKKKKTKNNLGKRLLKSVDQAVAHEQGAIGLRTSKVLSQDEILNIVRDTWEGYEHQIKCIKSERGFLSLAQLEALAKLEGGAQACRFLMGRIYKGE